MKLLFWIVLKLRLRQKFWADLYLRWNRKQLKKVLDSMDLNTSNIKFISHDQEQ